MAGSKPDNAISNLNPQRMQGIPIFVSGIVSLDGSGEATVPHGLPQPTLPSGAGHPGLEPLVVFPIPLDGGDHGSIAITVDATNIVVTGGAANGSIILVGMGTDNA